MKVNSFSQKWLIGFFLKFSIKLVSLKGQKQAKLNFSEKFSFWGKSSKNSSKTAFLAFVKNLIY